LDSDDNETFVLAPSNGGGAPDTFTAAFEVADPTSEKFTLTVVWEKAKQNVKLSDFNANFGYVVKCAPPEGGFANPAVGKVTLSGGKNPVSTDPAKASVVVRSA
jgi:hypothetical protein